MSTEHRPPTPKERQLAEDAKRVTKGESTSCTQSSSDLTPEEMYGPHENGVGTQSLAEPCGGCCTEHEGCCNHDSSYHHPVSLAPTHPESTLAACPTCGSPACIGNSPWYQCGRHMYGDPSSAAFTCDLIRGLREQMVALAGENSALDTQLDEAEQQVRRLTDERDALRRAYDSTRIAYAAIKKRNPHEH